MNEFDGSEARDAAQAQARGLLVKTTLLLKLATMHQLTNQALKGPVAALVEAVNQALAAGEQVALQVVGENVFLNRDIIRLDQSSFESATVLRTLFTRLGVGEVSFTAALEPQDVLDFLATFQRCWSSKQPEAFRSEKFPKLAVRAIGKVTAGTLGAAIDERQNVLRCFALLALNLEQVGQRLSRGLEPRMVAVRRALQSLADASQGHESLLVGLTRFPSLSGAPRFHLASVAALCLLMGRRLGLPRTALVELGLAAAFHDVARLTENAGESAEAAAHVSLRSGLLLSRVPLTPESVARLAAALEVPLPVGARTPLPPSALARLVAVPCAFELMTSPGAGRTPMAPDLALRLLLDKAGTRFDRRAALLFASVVGLYPVGTTVQLSSGETAVVVEAPADPSQLSRPRVKVVRDARGQAADALVDLSRAGEARTIVGTLDPSSLDVHVPELLLA